jgi:DNA repair exonuclease SbcCD ATPase subunit
MRINKLSFQNLGSYGNNMTVVEFPEKYNLFLITGENGHGKSFIQDAVNFVLFGNPFRKIRKGDLVNRINGKGLYIKMELTANNAEWTIERTLKDIKIMKNGQPVELDAHIVDIQKYIDTNIVGASENLYRTTNLVSMRGFQSFFNLPKEKRRGIFETMIGIQILSNMKKMFMGKLTAMTSEKQSLERELDTLTESFKNTKSNLKKLSEIKEVDNTDEIEKIKSEIEKIKVEIDKLTEKKKEYPSLKEIRDLESDMTKIINENKVNVRTSEKYMSELNDDMNFFKDNIVCPRCKKPLTLEEKEREIEKIKISIEGLQKKMDECKSVINEKQKELNEIQSIEDEFRELADKIDRKNKEISNNEYRIRLLSSNSTNSNDVIKTELENQLIEYKNKISTKNEELGNTNDYLDILNLFKTILGDDGIKKFVYSKFLPILNNNINKILKQFEFNIHFELLESLEEIIHNSMGEIISINSLSNGEQQLVDVSFMFGVQKFLQQVNSYHGDICFIDELFDASLDANNMEKILNFLRQIEGQVIIITHKLQMKDSFDCCFRVVKENNFSKIYVE